MLDVIALILPFFGLIAVGAVTGRWKRLPLVELGWLNVFVVYLALPALFFRLLSRTPVEKLTQWDFIGANVGVTFAVLCLTFGLALVRTAGKVAEAAVQGLAGAYGNIGYMGPGLALLVFGEDAAVPVALIFCFENILHFVFAPAAMAVAGTASVTGWRLVALVARQIVTHPFIVATILGVGAAFLGLRMPDPVDRLIGYLAQAAAPCALFSMGVALSLRPLRRIPGELAFIIPIKLVLHPLLMAGVLGVAGDFDPVWVATAVLLAALPTATNVYVIAQQYDIWMERASASILATTLLSVVTVSLVLLALKGGLLAGLT